MNPRESPWTCETCDNLGVWTTRDPNVAAAHGKTINVVDGFASLPCPDCSGTGHADAALALLRTPRFAVNAFRALRTMLHDHPRLPKPYVASAWYKLYVRETLRQTKRILRSKLG